MKKIIITIMTLLAIVLTYEAAGTAEILVGTTIKSFPGKHIHIEGYSVQAKMADGLLFGIEAHEAELWTYRYNGRHYEADEEPLWFIEAIVVKNITKNIYAKVGSGIESVGLNVVHSANFGAIIPLIAGISLVGEAGFCDYRYIHGRTVSVGVSRLF
ncbi:MAG: hypothetical protein HGA59_01360 [Chlorobiaceae bacterium]|nr:hypothetical protein [Chlorobiaceae bacterium]NTV16878.1 hypothetical protein [Chlorobiaceae bacterium]